MIALAGAGQKDTTVLSWMTYDTSSTRLVFHYDSTMQPKYDTVAIIYLYTDTAGVRNIYDTLANGWIRINELGVFWDFGYEVRQETGLIPVTSRENNMLFDWVMSYKFVGYLDRQKNPIRKSMIIFNVKNIQ